VFTAWKYEMDRVTGDWRSVVRQPLIRKSVVAESQSPDCRRPTTMTDEIARRDAVQPSNDTTNAVYIGTSVMTRSETKYWTDF